MASDGSFASLNAGCLNWPIYKASLNMMSSWLAFGDAMAAEPR